jgi:hypothetical protein
MEDGSGHSQNTPRNPNGWPNYFCRPMPSLSSRFYWGFGRCLRRGLRKNTKASMASLKARRHRRRHRPKSLILDEAMKTSVKISPRARAREDRPPWPDRPCDGRCTRVLEPIARRMVCCRPCGPVFNAAGGEGRKILGHFRSRRALQCRPREIEGSSFGRVICSGQGVFGPDSYSAEP